MKFWKISLFYFHVIENHWNEVWFRTYLLLLNEHFVPSLRATSAREHFELSTQKTFLTQLWISRIPVDISRCTSCIHFKLAVTMARKCEHMWVYLYLGHVIDENRFHNCVGEFYFYFQCQKKELLRIMRVENWIEQHNKQYSYLIQRFYSQLLRYN